MNELNPLIGDSISVREQSTSNSTPAQFQLTAKEGEKGREQFRMIQNQNGMRVVKKRKLR